MALPHRDLGARAVTRAVTRVKTPSADAAAESAPAAPAPAGRPVTRADASRIAVRLEGLSKRFPVRRGWGALLRNPTRREFTPVLRDVTCEIREGEFFGLLGPNGAGKTTLFKILATLVTPDSGSVTVEGFDVRRDAASVRRLLTPVVTDERSLHWRISARENLRLFAALHGVDAQSTPTRVGEVLEVVGLSDVGNKNVGSFSSGMKQRLLIARALLSRPRVLLLDEPTRSLDPVSARRFREFLRTEISERQGCTILLATHNAEEALELCDRVAVLDRGRLLAAGAADELARDFGDERYRLWTRGAADEPLRALQARGMIRRPHALEGDDVGWTKVEMEVPGGLDEAAQVVDFLTCAGVPVARFERVEPTLAELIERVVERRSGEAGHA